MRTGDDRGQCAEDEKLKAHREKQRKTRNAEPAVPASEWVSRPDETFKIRQLAFTSNKPFDLSITLKKGFKPTAASEAMHVFELDEGGDRPFIGTSQPAENSPRRAALATP